MERNNVLGMVCGYYPSRLDATGYEHLGYGSQQATHDALGVALQVPSASIKNWRDEFDPVHENSRKGWHKREMSPSRKRALEALGQLLDSELHTLVRALAAKPSGRHADEVVRILAETPAEDEQDDAFGLRGPTGARAELAFQKHHARTGEPIAGELVDRTSDQCGFDFAIHSPSGLVAVEVKGLAGREGGVTFTEKEWTTAGEMRNAYYLAIVRNVLAAPEVSLVRDPAGHLDAHMRTHATIQVGWAVSQRSVRAAEQGATG